MTGGAPAARDVWVVVPAYNEGRAIGAVVADVLGARHRALVVDDGSSDDTAAIARAAGAIVLVHPINLGQGAALQTGIDYALANGADVIVTFDADGQHRAAEIARLVEALERDDAHFALGSRFLADAPKNMPVSRRWLLRAATLFTRVTTGLRVTDAHNGFRAMTRDGARSIRLRQNRMAHASELLHQIAASRRKYVEAPVTVEYTAYSLAKGQKLSSSLYILLDLIARSLHR